MTVSGRSGHRTIFGCASALRHILSPERSSLTLASDADLSQRWINVLQLELARDWTWDDLAEEGFTVQRRLSRPGQPDEIAQACLWLCSDESSFTTGHALAVDGGYLAR